MESFRADFLYFFNTAVKVFIRHSPLQACKDILEISLFSKVLNRSSAYEVTSEVTGDNNLVLFDL